MGPGIVEEEVKALCSPAYSIVVWL